MLDTLKSWYKNITLNGINFIYANDKNTGQPSITLFFAYLAGLAALASLLALHFNEKLLTATTMSFVFFAVCVIFYMIRKINKASFDLDDKSVSIENNESEDKK